MSDYRIDDMTEELGMIFKLVASIDEVVVNGDHAEANVTSYLASDPSNTSTRSFDLQFRDDQWKICESN